MKKLIALLACFCFVFACHAEVDKTTNQPDAQVVADSVVHENVSGPDLSPFEGGACLNPDASQDSCSSQVFVHQAENWVVAASGEWQPRENPIPQILFTLANVNKKLLITLVKDEAVLNSDAYVDAQVNTLKHLGINNVSREEVQLNGVNYSLVKAPESNLNNWQWTYIKDKTAYVWSCGSPKSITPDYDACLDVISTAQIN